MAGAAHFSLREQWKELRRGRPGHRFQDRYEHARETQKSKDGMQRVLLIGAGVVALIIAAVFSVIPGPAIPFFFIGGALLATESRIIARFMDWCEVRIRKVLAWAKRSWRRLPTYGRALVVGLAVCFSAAAAYGGYRLFM